MEGGEQLRPDALGLGDGGHIGNMGNPQLTINNILVGTRIAVAK